MKKITSAIDVGPSSANGVTCEQYNAPSPHTNVISTEATDSLIVRCAVERSLYLFSCTGLRLSPRNSVHPNTTSCPHFSHEKPHPAGNHFLFTQKQKSILTHSTHNTYNRHLHPILQNRLIEQIGPKTGVVLPEEDLK
ncbi:MAG TPA: hypothetical protein VK578_09580 [Edaphobacter sp.]|nr:hypothetical protein [Edaphobacter sp.]